MPTTSTALPAVGAVVEAAMAVDTTVATIEAVVAQCEWAAVAAVVPDQGLRPMVDAVAVLLGVAHKVVVTLAPLWMRVASIR